jgi:CRISPR system Cascade subunit CasB
MPAEISVESSGVSRPSISNIVERLAAEMLMLDPGPLAELRRMGPDGPGNAAYWRLASRCGFLDEKADAWMGIVKIMAILTSKGERRDGDKLHESRHGLGEALCDGGDPKWPRDGSVEARPAYSEKRLARFLAEPAAMRAGSLERIARVLARTRSRDRGLNCRDIAYLLVTQDQAGTLRKIARDYYRRLDTTRAIEHKDPKP